MECGIRKARIKAGLTQEALAKRLNITQGAVWQWESGRTMPSADKLKEMAQILDQPIEALLDGLNRQEGQLK